MDEEGTCSICGREYTHYGNNAEPVNSGRCCDTCNATVVVPRRMTDMGIGRSEYTVAEPDKNT